jgi:flagellar motility protein MotE (MotC chaperone)
VEEEPKRLTTLKQEIDVKLARLEKIQDAIQAKLDEQKALGDERIKHLIKIYTIMPPKKAASLIEKLDMNVIISLFSSMKGENVGQILPYVSAEKAAAISERLVKQGL